MLKGKVRIKILNISDRDMETQHYYRREIKEGVTFKVTDYINILGELIVSKWKLPSNCGNDYILKKHCVVLRDNQVGGKLL